MEQKIPFEERYTFNQRFKEAIKLKTQYPGFIPIILSIEKKSQIPAPAKEM